MKNNTQIEPTLEEFLIIQEKIIQILKLDSDLLLARIRNGGHSGKFLTDAFISCYRRSTLFNHSLGEVMELDYEAASLFQQILHIRFLPNWSDTELCKLETEILSISSEIY